MRRMDEMADLPSRMRPSLERAAAAARLAGARADGDAVAARMRQAASRARSAGPAPGRPARPAPGRGATGSEPTPPMASSGAAALAVAAPVRRPTPVPEEQPRPRHLRVVPDGALTPAQRRRRARAIVMAGIGTAAMIGLALVYFHVVLAQRQFAIDRLQSQVQKAQQTYQTQRLQVAELGSPGHIISTAEGQLGMTQPSGVVYLTPPPGTSATSGSTATRPLGQTEGTAAPSAAPAGDANWPQIKSQLAGTP